jgi:hypothetical protein
MRDTDVSEVSVERRVIYPIHNRLLRRLRGRPVQPIHPIQTLTLTFIHGVGCTVPKASRVFRSSEMNVVDTRKRCEISFGV